MNYHYLNHSASYCHLQYEPLEFCLHKSIINKEQYEAALWYTNLYWQFSSHDENNGQIHALYKNITKELMKHNSYVLIRDVCISKIYPPFLHDNKKEWDAYKHFNAFLYGLEIILEYQLNK